jgi:hypothetical protein
LFRRFDLGKTNRFQKVSGKVSVPCRPFEYLLYNYGFVVDYENKILPWEEGGGEKGHLIVTEDDEKGGISSNKIDQIIKSIFG